MYEQEERAWKGWIIWASEQTGGRVRGKPLPNLALSLTSLVFAIVCPLLTVVHKAVPSQPSGKLRLLLP